MAPSQRMPSLDSLRIFEVVVRLGGFTAAAKALNVTQSAVSQRVVALEAELGLKLFQRTTRRLVLTPDGEGLAAGVRRGVAEIEDAVNALRRRKGAVLRVTTTPSFAAHWLVPRLRGFRAVMPDVSVSVVAESSVVNLQAGEADLALRFGSGHYPGLVSTLLLDDAVVPVARPDFLADKPAPQSPFDLLRFPLVIDASNETEIERGGWSHWFASLGLKPPRELVGEGFSQSSLAVRAATSGLGVALAQLTLAGDDLIRGTLVPVWPHQLVMPQSYHLVMTRSAAKEPAVQAFRDWIMAEADAFRAALAEVGVAMAAT